MQCRLVDATMVTKLARAIKPCFLLPAASFRKYFNWESIKETPLTVIFYVSLNFLTPPWRWMARHITH